MRLIFTLIYCLIYLMMFPFAKLVAIFNGKFSYQMGDRRVDPAYLEHLKKVSNKRKASVVFFCSSAGEFEQAIPLINRLEATDYFTHTFFFSRSGYDFARSREFEFSHCLAPVDLPWIWSKYLNALKPTATFVIRYELWPGFLYSAYRSSPIYLVDASKTNSRVDFFTPFLLGYFKKIFCTSEETVFQKLTPKLRERAIVTGDTKYDRVLERAAANQSTIALFKQHVLETFGTKKILVLGSCWPADIDLFIKAWIKAGQALKNEFAVILAPHDIRAEKLVAIEKQLSPHRLDCIRFSRWMNDASLAHQDSFVLVDTMGKLAEIYGTGHCAFVGGAIHNKVHNVLEPASHGLAICFGPRYHSQPEAISFVKQRVASVVSTPDELLDWLKDQQHDTGNLGSTARKAVESLAGATEKILDNVPELKI